MKRLSSWALPIVLGVAGVVLIMLGLDGGGTDGSGESLPPIGRPTATASRSTPSQPGESLRPSASATPSDLPSPSAAPTATPLPSNVVATQLEVPSVGVNVIVRQSTSEATDNFPPSDAAYILRSGNQPGRNENAYVFAHAVNTLFKPLWNVQLGAEVLVRMSDGTVLRYLVTEIRPNVACPDPNADPALDPPDPPLALQIHDDCSQGARWTAQTGYERLTLQTSQGYNRNWGELVVIAEPAF